MVLIETIACLLWLLLLLTELHKPYAPYAGTRTLRWLWFVGSASMAVPLSVAVGLAGIAFGEPLTANLNRILMVGALGQTLSWACLFRRGLTGCLLGSQAPRLSQSTERELILLIASFSGILHNSRVRMIGGLYGSHNASH